MKTILLTLFIMAISIPTLASTIEFDKNNTEQALQLTQELTEKAHDILNIKNSNKDDKIKQRYLAYCNLVTDYVNINEVTMKIFRYSSKLVDQQTMTHMQKTIQGVLASVLTDQFKSFAFQIFDWNEATVRYRPYRTINGKRVHGYRVSVMIYDQNSQHDLLNGTSIRFHWAQDTPSSMKLSLIDLDLRNVSFSKFLAKHDQKIRAGAKTLPEVLTDFNRKYGTCTP